MAEVLDGREVARAIRDSVAEDVVRLKGKGLPPCLATIRVGESPADAAYERSIAKMASELGILCKQIVLPADVEESSVLAEIARANADESVSGCMLFRPLPQGIDEILACNSICVEKDVDGVGAKSLAGVFMGLDEGFAPATAEACIAILDHYGIALDGARVAVVGRSLVIGKPVGMLALSRNATVTYCHSRTRGLKEATLSADIVICAIGKAAFFDGSFFRDDGSQTVLDVGMNAGSDGRLCGDVDFESVQPKVAAITPVPGGVGSVTTSILLRHVVGARKSMRKDGRICQ